MTTDKQKESNKKNAQKSTGPTSVEGKAKCARNAARHGLFTTTALMSDERKEDFDLVLTGLNEEHEPQGDTECSFVYRMAVSLFSFWRATTLLTERLEINDQPDPPKDSYKQVSLMLRYQTTHDRAFNRNFAELRKLQKERQKEETGSASQDPLSYLTFTPEPCDPEHLKDYISPLILPDYLKNPGEPPKKAA